MKKQTTSNKPNKPKSNKPNRPKVQFKKEVRIENGREVVVLHPLPPKKEPVNFPGKAGYIKTAKELYYPTDIINRLKQSSSEREAECIMADGRRWLDRFDYGQEAYGQYSSLDKKLGCSSMINMVGGKRA